MADEPERGDRSYSENGFEELAWDDEEPLGGDEGLDRGQEGLGAACDTLGDFLDSASVDRVYGEPVVHGETLVIPAAEIVAALGFGVGSGRSRAPACCGLESEREAGGDEGGPGECAAGGLAGAAVDADDGQPPLRVSGGGGAGRTFARPVALVIVSAEGVRVRPVVDTTKIVLASLATAAFIAASVAWIFAPRSRA